MIVGKGTGILAEKKRGDSLNVIGPLGRGYRIPEQSKRIFLVGGGLGVAPLPLLCQRILALQKTPEVHLGAKTRHDLVLVEDFRTMGIAVYPATEDGSMGKKGFMRLTRLSKA